MCFLQCSTKVCVQRDLIPPPLNQSSLLMVPPMMELPFLASHTNLRWIILPLMRMWFSWWVVWNSTNVEMCWNPSLVSGLIPIHLSVHPYISLKSTAVIYPWCRQESRMVATDEDGTTVDKLGRKASLSRSVGRGWDNLFMWFMWLWARMPGIALEISCWAVGVLSEKFRKGMANGILEIYQQSSKANTRGKTKLIN